MPAAPAGTSLSWETWLLKGEKPAQGFSSSPSLSTRVVWTHQMFGSWGFIVVVWFVFLHACQKGALRTLYLSSSSQCLSAWGKRRHSYSLPINLSFSLWFGRFSGGFFLLFFSFFNQDIFPTLPCILLYLHSVSKHILISCPNMPKSMALCDCHYVIRSHFI